MPASSVALSCSASEVKPARSAKPTATAGEGGAAGLVHRPGPPRRPGPGGAVEGGEDGLDLGQHHPGEALVAVGDVEVGAAGLQERDLEGQAQHRHLGLGDAA